jgi:integrase
MSVRKRTWTSATGEVKGKWVADYVDAQGKRRLKTFDKKRDADKFAANAAVEVDAGIHVADSASISVAEAGKLWVSTTEKAGRERSTVDQYRQHVNLHIVPFLGSKKLTALTVPVLRKFEDDLRDAGRSSAMVKKVMVSVGSLLADAMERGSVARNVVREMRKRRGSVDAKAEKRAKGRLKVGVDIPTTDEIRAVVQTVQGRWRAVVLLLTFGGLRASELRGLRWPNVDLSSGRVHVRERADRYKRLGAPKSEAGERTVPLPPMVINALREWKLAGPSSAAELVFQDGNYEPLAHRTIADAFMAAQVRAGITVRVATEDGGEEEVAKYSGLHCLRHFYASWCINRRTSGGLELPAKMVQDRLGHSSIALTLDLYSHLFPSTDDGAELAAAEGILFGR